MMRYPLPKPWMLVLGASLIPCAGSAGAKTPVRKELEALNQQVAALSAQLAASNARLATISEQIAGLGGAPKALHAVQLCVEAGERIANVQSVLTRSVAIQNVVNAIRTLVGRVCTAVDAIPGVNPDCSV